MRPEPRYYNSIAKLACHILHCVTDCQACFGHYLNRIQIQIHVSNAATKEDQGVHILRDQSIHSSHAPAVK